MLESVIVWIIKYIIYCINCFKLCVKLSYRFQQPDSNPFRTRKMWIRHCGLT